MINMKSLFALTLFSITAYGQVESDILIKAAESIKKLKSIKYTVVEQNRHENISADVTLMRDKPYPLFGISRIKVIGIAINDHGSEQIQFTSNGTSFQYYDVSQSKVIQIDEPTDRKLFRTSISKYLLLPLIVYHNEKPFENIVKQLKTVSIIHDTIIFEQAAIKVRVSFESKNFDGSPLLLSSYWYFRKTDYLVIGQVSKVSRIFLKIKEVNQEYTETEFSLIDERQIKRVTGNEPRSEGLLPVGSNAPNFTLQSPTLGEFTLYKNRGKVILLDFWGTWCAPCIKAMPEIQKIHNYFTTQDVLIIGVSVEPEQATKPEQFMNKKGFTYPILLGGTSITEPYQVMIFPTIYIIDKNGKILHAEHGTGREGFTQEVIDIISKAIKN